ncbi:MAG: DUF4402 domain-containing protein [Alphaproteobacteria bacterium]
MKLFRTYWVIFTILFYSFPASAGVTAIQDLYFGHYLVLGNKVQADVTINTDGSHSFDPAGFVEIDPPREGIYDIDELPANMAVDSVEVSSATNLLNAGIAFQTRDWQTSFDPATDAGGNLRVVVGGTLRSSGNTVEYPDGTYIATLQIDINF